MITETGRMSSSAFRTSAHDSKLCGNITKQNKLMKLAENIKGKKKRKIVSSDAPLARGRRLRSDVIRQDPGYTPSIEHLVYGVYRSKETTPPPPPPSSTTSQRMLGGSTDDLVQPEVTSRPADDHHHHRRDDDQQCMHDRHRCQCLDDSHHGCFSMSLQKCDCHSSATEQHLCFDGNTIYVNMPALQGSQLQNNQCNFEESKDRNATMAPTREGVTTIPINFNQGSMDDVDSDYNYKESLNGRSIVTVGSSNSSLTPHRKKGSTVIPVDFNQTLKDCTNYAESDYNFQESKPVISSRSMITIGKTDALTPPSKEGATINDGDFSQTLKVLPKDTNGSCNFKKSKSLLAGRSRVTADVADSSRTPPTNGSSVTKPKNFNQKLEGSMQDTGCNFKKSKSLVSNRNAINSTMPIIKNLSLSGKMDSLTSSSKEGGRLNSTKNVLTESQRSKQHRRRSAPNSIGLRNSQKFGCYKSESVLPVSNHKGSTKSYLPIPKYAIGQKYPSEAVSSKKPMSNHRSSSCDGRRSCPPSTGRTLSGSSEQRYNRRASVTNGLTGASTPKNELTNGTAVREDKAGLSKKYPSALQMGSSHNLRSSSGNIEKKITAFKRNRAMSESTLAPRRVNGTTASMIPMPVASGAGNSGRGSRRSKYLRNSDVNSAGAALRTSPDCRQVNGHNEITPTRGTSGEISVAPGNNESPDDDEASEWCNVPEIRVLQHEQSPKHKSASENVDMLIMTLPDTSDKFSGTTINNESTEDTNNQHKADSSTNNECPDDLNNKLIGATSISILCDRRGSEPPSNHTHRPRSLLTFSDSDLNSNSNFYCPFPDSHFTPRFSSLRTHSDYKAPESVLKKFKKSFSLRFHRNRRSEFFSDPQTPTDEKDDRSTSPSPFFCVNDQVVIDDDQLPSFHPATVSGVSPITVRKNDHSPVNAVNSTNLQMKSSSPDYNSFKHGLVTWRSSRDKKKSGNRKEVRGSKCSSTDSGIQVELSGASTPTVQVTDHDSSPSVKHCGSKQGVVIGTSPIVVRRRSKLSAEARHPRRPYSDLGGSINDPSLLAEAIRVGLVIEDGTKAIKRTLSDLTSQEYGKLYANNELTYRMKDRKTQLRTNLRRSNSQPVACYRASETSSLTPMDNQTLYVGYSSRPKSNSLSLSNNHLCTPRTEPENNAFSPATDDQAFQTYTCAEAVWDHVTMDPEELAFKAGDVVQVVDASNDDWWWGIINNRSGWFPASFVWLRVNQEKSGDDSRTDPNKSMGGDSPSAALQLNNGNLNNDQIRTNIIKEIVSSEQDYVTHLKDVSEGYLSQVIKRPDMFSEEQISTIFGNIEQIHSFQRLFLKDLESSMDWVEPHKSKIGSCFLQHEAGFQIYSEYCNNHPQALSLLQDLYANPKYIHFFEACRLLQDMIDISLDGFLLNPVQKICKYPLQLAELLKYTNVGHPDYDCIKQAQQTMKNVAHLVNERKRRMECLEKLILWQHDIVDWEGPNLIDTSSELIYAGEVSKLTTWSREVSLFLFDHQLIYCKRDLLKRNVYIYKGRINMDVSEVTSIDDCKDSHFGISVKNAWKINCKNKNKSYLFHTRTLEEKERWLAAFSKERRHIQEDAEQGFKITEKARRQAIMAADKARMNKRPKGKAVKHPGYLTGPLTKQSARSVLAEDFAPNECSLKSRTGSLPHGVSLSVNLELTKKKNHQSSNSWFSFGSTKKTKR